MAKIPNIQYNRFLHRNEVEVMFRLEGDHTFFATPALTHVPDAEKEYLHQLLGLTLIQMQPYTLLLLSMVINFMLQKAV